MFICSPFATTASSFTAALAGADAHTSAIAMTKAAVRRPNFLVPMLNLFLYPFAEDVAKLSDKLKIDTGKFVSQIRSNY